MRISFLGDISLNDNYIELYQKGVNPFVAVQPVLSGSDFVMGNLECIAKGEFGENEQKKPRLTTSVETLNLLKSININIVCLAQNHIYDHLKDGFIRTTNFLDANGIQHLGAGLSEENALKPIILINTDHNLKVAVLNYVTKDTNTDLPYGAEVYLNMFDLEKCKQDILKVKENVNHIILSLHWGGRVEGGLFPDWTQPKIAHELIDAGADLIIGHHSHTIQPYEIYKGKYIFYSLGNFCFADYTFEGKFNPMPKRRRISIVVNVLFNTNDYEIKLEYFENKMTHFVRLPNYNYKHSFRNFIFKILRISFLFWSAYYFHLKYILPVVLFYKRSDISFSEKSSRFINSIKLRVLKNSNS